MREFLLIPSFPNDSLLHVCCFLFGWKFLLVNFAVEYCEIILVQMALSTERHRILVEMIAVAAAFALKKIVLFFFRFDFFLGVDEHIIIIVIITTATILIHLAMDWNRGSRTKCQHPSRLFFGGCINIVNDTNMHNHWAAVDGFDVELMCAFRCLKSIIRNFFLFEFIFYIGHWTFSRLGRKLWINLVENGARASARAHAHTLARSFVWSCP